jgi:hypothetical protein
MAMPMASIFIANIVGALLSGLAFIKARKWIMTSSYLLAATFILIGIGISIITLGLDQPVHARYSTANHPANEPIGEAKGLFPGRVVWVHHPDATNENCNPGEFGHGWFLDENNNQAVIDNMLSRGIRELTGVANDSSAWIEIFRFFNRNNDRGDRHYQNNETIFLKINVTSSWSGNINTSDLSKVENQWYGISETSPHLVLAVLKQLIHVVGVPQAKIYVGDPMKHIYKHCFDKWSAEFPKVHYIDHDGFAGREKVSRSNSAMIHYSDRGAVLRAGTWDNASVGDTVFNDYLYKIFENVDYMINIPTLKGHKHAGITAFPKNHFGSHTRDDAKHLHGGLVAPETNNPRRQGYGLYRVQVDIMGHKLLGKKNLFYLLDGLWTSDYEIDEPDKWRMQPFNDDWMSSIFVSQDPVAIESVGFDFLRSEFTDKRGLATYPQMIGVDDYLHQAADSINWPEGIKYDPEYDGSTLASLGVHEHWNNPLEKQYTRNMGRGKGIELIYVSKLTAIQNKNLYCSTGSTFRLFNNYPNPFNSTTRIKYYLNSSASVEIIVYDVLGHKVSQLISARQTEGNHQVTWNPVNVTSGIYFVQLKVTIKGMTHYQTQKLIFSK